MRERKTKVREKQRKKKEQEKLATSVWINFEAVVEEQTTRKGTKLKSKLYNDKYNYYKCNNYRYRIIFLYLRSETRATQ